MKKILYLLPVLFLLSNAPASATHLMGGQITALQVSGLTYEVKLVLYRDTSGIPINPVETITVEDLSNLSVTTYGIGHTGMNPFFNGVEVYEYIDTITFPGPGQFRIYWEDCCRNGAILNMANPLGETMNLMTEVTSDGLSNNSTPVFLNPPIILAQKYSLFQYNPLPYDADGDSLAWLLEVPLGLNGDTVLGYTIPHADPSQPFALNPFTGEVTWMPDSNGHWEASFRVEEYRNGIKIGEIRRDMQIIVVDDTTNWFRLVFNNGSWPQNAQGNFAMTLNANTPFVLTLTAADPDNDWLALDVFGEPMILSVNHAQWTINNTVPGSVTGTFTWTPDNSQVRTLPYTVAFRGYEFHNQSVFTLDQTLQLSVQSSTGIKETPGNFTFNKLFPNPANGAFYLSFELKKSAAVTIEVHDLLGRSSAVVLDKTLPAGSNLVQCEDPNLESGFYMVRIRVNGEEPYSLPLILR